MDYSEFLDCLWTKSLSLDNQWHKEDANIYGQWDPSRNPNISYGLMRIVGLPIYSVRHCVYIDKIWNYPDYSFRTSGSLDYHTESCSEGNEGGGGWEGEVGSRICAQSSILV